KHMDGVLYALYLSEPAHRWSCRLRWPDSRQALRLCLIFGMVLVATAAWATADFTISAQYPSTQQLYGQQGNSPTATITLTGNASTFTWMNSTPPTGITVSFSPTTCAT